MPSRISQFLETRTLFLGHHSPTHASVEDCPQGSDMHQDLMFIPRKGTRQYNVAVSKNAQFGFVLEQNTH